MSKGKGFCSCDTRRHARSRAVEDARALFRAPLRRIGPAGGVSAAWSHGGHHVPGLMDMVVGES